MRLANKPQESTSFLLLLRSGITNRSYMPEWVLGFAQPTLYLLTYPICLTQPESLSQNNRAGALALHLQGSHHKVQEQS